MVEQARRDIPKIDPRIVGGFHWFCKSYVKKSFHSFAVDAREITEAGIMPADCVVMFANHASWWDPIMALLLHRKFLPAFRMYAPIDAEALRKYRMFAKMGFYPIDQTHLRGAAEFLKTSMAIVSEPAAAIWMTPEGRFADPRDHSVDLMPGLSHLASRIVKRQVAWHKDDRAARPPRVWFMAGAVEYTFWEERLPEVICRFSRPINGDLAVAEREMANPRNKAEWHQRLTDLLRSTQRKLATAAIERDSSQFEVVIGGQTGSFLLYDWWRKLKSKLGGQTIDVSHSDKLRVR